MKNSLDKIRIPAISRFSPPWDADGWYYVCAGFGKKCEVYSNSDVCVAKLPSSLEDAEYIVTYDSLTDGTDDHQECDFFLENDAEIFVAFDSSAKASNALPDWLGEYEETGDEVVLDDKSVYLLFKKAFPAGSHVIVPGFEGNFRHYFVIAKADEKYSELPLVRVPVTDRVPETYEKREYYCYVSESFNSGIPDDYEYAGDVSVVSPYDDENYRSVKLCGKSYIKTVFACSEKTVVKTSVTLLDENGEYFFGALSVKNGTVFCGDKEICKANFGVPTTLCLRYDFSAETVNVEINHVRSGKCLPADVSEPASFLCDGEMLIDYLLVEDDREIFVCDDDMTVLPKLRTSEGADVSLTCFPFDENKSVRLSGGAASYDFASVSGKMSIEARVFASGSGRCTVLATDEQGRIAAGAALFASSVYAVKNGGFENALDTLTPYCYYPAGNWYEVRFVIDTEKKTYDLWIDGACRESALPLCDKVSCVCSVEFSSAEDDFFINHLRVYDDVSLARGVTRGEVFDVKKFGAKGNGKTDDTEAINKAIAAAAYTGGTVLIRDGVFSSGEIKLASDMTLFVDPSATVIGSQDHGKYPLRVPGRSLCAHRQLGRGLIYGEKVRNVTVTGGGTLDGNGKYRFKMNDPLARREQDARPDIVYIAYSSDLTVENLNMRRSAFWTVVPLSSTGVTVRNLRLNCMNTPNRDGIDPVDCKNISVYHCNVMAGDDGLCFKSSDVFGCENIDVYDMMISSLASAVKFGTDTYYTLCKAAFRDCFIKNVNRCGVSLETVDGAYVSDVLFERFDITDASAPAYVVTGARNRLPKEVTDIRTSKIDGVTFRGLNFRSPRTHGHPLPIYETLVVGQSAEQSIDNITFENCNLVAMGGVSDSTAPAPSPINNKYPEYDQHGLSAGYAFTFRYCSNPQLKNINITEMLSPDNRPLSAFFDIVPSGKR